LRAEGWCDGLAGFGAGVFDRWEEEGEDGAVVDRVLGASEGEATVMAVDDADGDPKPEAGSVEVLGGVERLEEAAPHGGRHAVTGVGDGDADAMAAVGVPGGVVRGIVGADEKAASLSHSVDGVGDEVVEDLANIVFEAEDGGAGGVCGVDVDAGVGEAAVVEVEDCTDKIGGADMGSANCLTMKTESLSGDLAYAGEFALRGLDVAACRFGEIVGESDEIKEIGDGFERVIDLVGDGAGEAAYGG